MTEELCCDEIAIIPEEEIGDEIKKEESLFRPHFTIREMLEAGVHFGHRTSRWNAKMAPFIYGVKNELHIIDLTQTAVLLSEAAKIVREIVKRHGKILFVCTKKQGAETVREVAGEYGQYFVTTKWLGGMLTNWKTISRSIKTLREIEKELEKTDSDLTKKEKLMLERKRNKLESQLGGIKEMTHLPDLLFIIDTPRESLAIAEARTLGIPVMGIIDTNSDPDKVDYAIPGNDDSIKAIALYMDVIGQALKDALENMPIRKEIERKPNDRRKDLRKPISKKPSKTFSDKREKSKFVKKEAKAPVAKEENKEKNWQPEIQVEVEC